LSPDGYVTLRNRSKDHIIISGGSNIYLREVEEARLHRSDVEEVAVVARFDRERGEVVRRPGSAIDSAALDLFCAQQISSYKRPKAYRFAGELPKNAYGKVLKRELRKLPETGSAQEAGRRHRRPGNCPGCRNWSPSAGSPCC
jgi:long-chain acyl-CoA synthetase